MYIICIYESASLQVCKSIFAWNSAQYFEAERNKYKKKQTNKQK